MLGLFGAINIDRVERRGFVQLNEQRNIFVLLYCLPSLGVTPKAIR